MWSFLIGKRTAGQLSTTQDFGNPLENRFGETDGLRCAGSGDFFLMSRVTGLHRVRSQRAGIPYFRRKHQAVLLGELKQLFDIMDEGKLNALKKKNRLEGFFDCLLRVETALFGENIISFVGNTGEIKITFSMNQPILGRTGRAVLKRRLHKPLFRFAALLDRLNQADPLIL